MSNFLLKFSDQGAFSSNTAYYIHHTVCYIFLALMFITAVLAVILVLLQPGNSTGIDALGGSSETFFGKNKGKSMEAKMKKATWICIALLGVFSVIFFIFSPLVF